MATPKWQEIDQDFPVAGQDNESQGFRDNFTAIKETLEYAEDEIITLQETTAKLDIRNEFGLEATLETVKLVAHAEQTFRPGQSIVSNQEVSYDTGSYHSLIIGTPTGGGNTITLNLAGFPIPSGTEDGRYARMRVDAVLGQAITIPKVLQFANTLGDIYYDSSWPAAITVSSQSTPVVMEFWSYDGGENIYASYLGVFGDAGKTTTFENISVSGNAALGNALTDTVTFHAIPKIPTVNGSTLPSIASAQVGMMVYNIDSNVVLACKRKSVLIPIIEQDIVQIVKGGRYVIVEVGGTDFTLVGAPNSSIGTVFDASWTGATPPLAFGGIGRVAEIEWVSLG
jgi:hypothetical protein